MNRQRIVHLTKIALFILATTGMVASAAAAECSSSTRTDPLNLTVPVTVQMPANAITAPVGAVLYKKEATLAQLTGTHRDITGACVEQLRKSLNGRISARQSGFNTFATTLPGLGLRITVIYDKAGRPRKEWVLPFTALVRDLTQAALTTDDIRLRFEMVKTGRLESGMLNLRLPSLLALNDNSLVVNLALTVLAAKAHCTIQVPNPQITLPPIDAAALASNTPKRQYPVGVNLLCLNTRQASISIEGVNDSKTASIFKNVSSENPAGGVGIEMLYNGSVMQPGRSMDIALPQQQSGFAVPLAVRYAKTHEKITQGKVKAQITLRINYL
ncbi:fimbrial protein [Siccibacter colletis]|uniref:fimbrial protein n=1 Tax=Siccibacter colletis TaxID=1505757 RepID=UPI0028BD7C91|nr:fimbrial protein [Siccibacter colletis]WNN48397.1 fimbrial protein [Siccibacter colletis]